MKKSNEPIDTRCRRALRKALPEAGTWLRAHPQVACHGVLSEQVERIREAGALAINIGETVDDDEHGLQVDHLIITLPPTDKKIERVLAAITKTRAKGQDEPDIGIHFVYLAGPPVATEPEG